MKIKLYANHSLELYKQLANELIRLIGQGIFQEGDCLPSIRQLATQLRVNPNTVQKAYQILHEKGIAYVAPKKRAVVKRHLPKEHVKGEIEEQLSYIIKEAKAQGLEKEELEFIVQSLLDSWG